VAEIAVVHAARCNNMHAKLTRRTPPRVHPQTHRLRSQPHSRSTLSRAEVAAAGAAAQGGASSHWSRVAILEMETGCSWSSL
jgi:hypothetical protein